MLKTSRKNALLCGDKIYIGKPHYCGCVIKYVSGYGCHYCLKKKGYEKLMSGELKKYHTKEKTKLRVDRWRKNNREKYEGQWLRSCIRRIGVNLTEEQYWEMVENQNGLCQICHQPDEKGRLCIDHCHETNEVRGLLCRNCNLGLGNFTDNIDKLQSAVLYLQGKQ